MNKKMEKQNFFFLFSSCEPDKFKSQAQGWRLKAMFVWKFGGGFKTFNNTSRTVKVTLL